jgi:hypothetical protein
MNKILKVAALLCLATVLYLQIKRDHSRPVVSNVKVDTIKKKVVIPEAKNKIIFKEPKIKIDTIVQTKVVYVRKPTDKDLLGKIKELEDNLKRSVDSIDVLNELYQASLVRDYKDTYKDSLIELTYENKVKGYLLESSIDYKILKKEVEYIEKTKTVTKIIPPKWSLNAGATFADKTLYGTLSYRNSNGFNYKLGLAGSGKYLFGFEIPIKTKSPRSLKP